MDNLFMYNLNKKAECSKSGMIRLRSLIGKKSIKPSNPLRCEFDEFVLFDTHCFLAFEGVKRYTFGGTYQIGDRYADTTRHFFRVLPFLYAESDSWLVFRSKKQKHLNYYYNLEQSVFKKQ